MIKSILIDLLDFITLVPRALFAFILIVVFPRFGERLVEYMDRKEKLRTLN